MSDLFAFTVLGLATGAIYAVAASGLVVTYTTSGIFNFAHGAVGMLAAFTYWQLRYDWGWPAPIALVLVLFVAAPVSGAIIERVIFRGLEGASEVTRLVVSVGLLVAFIGLANVIWDPSVGRPFPRFFGDDATIKLPGNVIITWHDVITMLVAIAVAIGLTAFLRGTRIGISMRAVVDSRSLAQLNGARPGLASMLSWAIGFSLAALAGVLLAPVLRLDVLALTFLIVNAYAAAMFGRLRSLPMTFVGGLALGLIESYAIGYLDVSRYPSLSGFESWFSQLRSAIPVLVLFIVLIVMPGSRERVQGMTRLREVVPKPEWRSAWIAAGVLLLVVAVLAVALHGDQRNLRHLSVGLAFGVILLSFVPLTGYGGQISLAQMSFAGIGAVTVAKWQLGGPAQGVLGLIAAFVVAAIVGAVIALPALRLRGIYLALATFAFAIFVDRVIFTQSVAFEGSSLRLERFRLLGLSVASDSSYAIFLAVMFAICALGVVALRRGPFGRRLQAMKDSPAACATLGIDLTRTKLAAFALSAGLAGLGGALLAGQKVTFDATSFDPTTSLIVLLMAVAGGVAMVSGALLGAMLYASFDFWVQIAPPLTKDLVANIVLLAPGLIGIGLARNPNGLAYQAVEGVRRWRETWARRRRREVEVAPEPGWDLETLGIDRPFTAADLSVIDERLDTAELSGRWSA